ncbi:MAG: type 2 isopentenyl-diphosphate Delta-isomerase [Candidatus Kapaibacterium sp.]
MSEPLEEAENPARISSRKEAHVRIVVEEDVTFRTKTTGLESFELEVDALPEIDADDVDCSVPFLSHRLRLPLMVTGMTGGYADAVRINGALARACNAFGVAMGLGSQRQALRSTEHHESFMVARREAPDVPLLANMGAVEVAGPDGPGLAERIVDLVHADALAIHLNALQELLQPEGSPSFRGVLAGIESCVRRLPVPVVVKEVGAGISASVARRLLDVGVRHIDIAGAGGTSWAGVELRRAGTPHLEHLWDAGIPTARCVEEVCAMKSDATDFTCIASGGISSGFDVAKVLALGADIAGAARPFLLALETGGEESLHRLFAQWKQQLRASMFIAGAIDVVSLRSVVLRDRTGTVVRPRRGP